MSPIPRKTYISKSQQATNTGARAWSASASKEHTITSISACEVALQLCNSPQGHEEWLGNETNEPLAFALWKFQLQFCMITFNSASFANTPLVLVVVWTATRQNRNGNRHRFASFLSPSLRGDNSTNDAIHSSQLESATCWCPFARHGGDGSNVIPVKVGIVYPSICGGVLYNSALVQNLFHQQLEIWSCWSRVNYTWLDLCSNIQANLS